MTAQRVRRLLPQAIGASLLAAATAVMFSPAAMAGQYTSYAPNGAGHTTYDTSNNHYRIHDTKGDKRAVAVIFERKNGDDVGFQSCHEGSGNSCPGDLPGNISGELYMATGVGLGADKSGYTFGERVKIPNA